jgi:hypothetical protein
VFVRRSSGVLERIAYISAAAEEQTAASVGAILEVSRSRNLAAGVTGLLIGGGHWWMQLIEGERPSLEPIWNSIRFDRRHSPVVLVQRRPIRQRSFSDWALQFREAQDHGFGDLLEELTGGVADPRLRDQVRRFAELFLASPGRKWSEVPA